MEPTTRKKGRFGRWDQPHLPCEKCGKMFCNKRELQDHKHEEHGY